MPFSFSDIKLVVSERLIQLRQRADWEWLEQEVGFDLRTITELNLSTAKLSKLARALELDYTSLVNGKLVSLSGSDLIAVQVEKATHLLTFATDDLSLQKIAELIQGLESKGCPYLLVLMGGKD